MMKEKTIVNHNCACWHKSLAFAVKQRRNDSAVRD